MNTKLRDQQFTFLVLLTLIGNVYCAVNFDFKILCLRSTEWDFLVCFSNLVDDNETTNKINGYDERRLCT